MDLIQKYHFYINLKKRKDKNKHRIKELKRFGINSPNRGYFKTSFGGETKVYFELKINN